MKIYHLGPLWKNENESVYLTYSLSGYIVGLLGEVMQIRTKSLIFFGANNIYLIFFQKSTNVKRKKLQNQVLFLLERICLQANWWLRRVIFLGAACVGWSFLNWMWHLHNIKTLLIVNGGITQVKQHADTATIHSCVKRTPIRHHSCNQAHQLHCSWLLKMTLLRQK